MCGVAPPFIRPSEPPPKVGRASISAVDEAGRSKDSLVLRLSNPTKAPPTRRRAVRSKQPSKGDPYTDVARTSFHQSETSSPEGGPALSLGRRSPSGPVTLTARDVMKHYGSQLILNRASVTVGAGARIGLVGPNGIGKSTLLRILAGGERPDDGVLIRSPQSLTVGYLPQEVDADPGETLRDYLARRTGIAEAEAKLQDSEAQLIDDPLAADAHATALDKWMSLGDTTSTYRAPLHARRRPGGRQSTAPLNPVVSPRLRRCPFCGRGNPSVSLPD